MITKNLLYTYTVKPFYFIKLPQKKKQNVLEKKKTKWKKMFHKDEKKDIKKHLVEKKD